MNEFWSRFVQELILAAVALFLPALLILIAAKVKETWARIKAWKPELATVLEEGAKMVVYAAEQSGIAGEVTDKKDYAINALQAYLNAHGWKGIDLQLIDAAIEAAVKEADFPHLLKSETLPE